MNAQALRKLFTLLLPFVSGSLIAQKLPADRGTDWKGSVAQCSISYPVKTINFLAAGGNKEGVVYNDSLLDAILSRVQPDSGLLVYFPAGTYRFKSDIRLPSNTVLRGETAGSTILKFNLGGSGNAIEISGKTKSYYLNLLNDASRNSRSLVMKDSGIISSGELLYLLDEDSTLVTSTWAFGSAGQVVKVLSAQGRTLTLSSPLRRDFLTSKKARVLRLIPVVQSGLEYLTIWREDASTGQTSNVNMEYSSHCFLRCVESYNCNFAHVAISYSAFNTVEGSYFKDGFSYGSGGKAYGVALQFASSDCHVFNNVFRHLRHAVLVQTGANGNVIGYNYALESYWTDVSLPSNSAGDLVLHGNYPYANLFEGNIVQNIVLDNSHGISGPYNTFHRNRADLYGIFMNNGAGNSMNFLSNEITGTGFLLGMYALTGTDHFAYGNNVNGTIYGSGTTLETDSSLYGMDLSGREYYQKTGFWPPMGTISKFNTRLNEAKARYQVPAYTACAYQFTQGLKPSFSTATAEITAYPSPCADILYLTGVKAGDEVIVMDRTGRVLLQQQLDASYRVELGHLPQGIYVVGVKRGGITRSVLFTKGN